MRLIFLILLLPSIAFGQITSVSGAFGLGKISENTQIPSGFKFENEITANSGDVIYGFYHFRINFKIKNTYWSFGRNNAVAGNSFRLDFPDENGNMLNGYDTRRQKSISFNQLTLLYNLVRFLPVKYISGKRNVMGLSLNLGLAYNGSFGGLGSDFVVSSSNGFSTNNVDTVFVSSKTYSTDEKVQSFGLMAEIEIGRINKILNLPSTFFLKFVFHQGLNIITTSEVSIQHKGISDDFSYTSRGSYAGIAIGFNIFRNKNYFVGSKLDIG